MPKVALQHEFRGAGKSRSSPASVHPIKMSFLILNLCIGTLYYCSPNQAHGALAPVVDQRRGSRGRDAVAAVIAEMNLRRSPSPARRNGGVVMANASGGQQQRPSSLAFAQPQGGGYKRRGLGMCMYLPNLNCYILVESFDL